MERLVIEEVKLALPDCFNPLAGNLALESPAIASTKHIP
ncbi:hypothetical protein M595_3560 [Lyngbya aestuarii BL J]|uniref:Uncharacterized protein n=1 Tax=Lyngbya aestuarii BL J TaxID=1348334 RepID=U7QEU5_9CYAN|nr:hypothetical protein M595_3560 [Lyngbya aestuarii BL J]